MPMRVVRSTLTALLLPAALPSVIQAQGKLPDGAFTFIPSTDELNWRPLGALEVASVYMGANGYSVRLYRLPPNKIGPPVMFPIDEVIRVQSGTLYFAFSKDRSAPRQTAARAYGPGSLILLPAGVTGQLFGGDDEVIFEATRVQNIARRSSE